MAMCDQEDQFNFGTGGISASVVDEHGNSVALKARKQKSKPGSHFIRIVTNILKHIGLLGLVVGYMFAGGYLFQALEQSNEVSVCEQKMTNYLDQLNVSSSRLLASASALTGDRAQLEQLIKETLVTFADQMFVLNFQPSTNCSDILNTEKGSQWNLANSVFFSATLITTIGYGNIAPGTFWGRITCVIYSLVGIPLMLVYLAIIGNSLAEGFRFIYVNIICCRCFYDFIRRRHQKRREMLMQWEDNLREHEAEEARRRGLPVPLKKTLIVEDDEPLDDASGEIVAVPLSISVIVLAVYVIFGAAIFCTWEEEWSLIDSAYYSFITISTIGLGDLVLGAGRLTEPGTTVELIFGGVYIAIGLAFLSMCINLLQEEVAAKIAYLKECFSHNSDGDDEEVNCDAKNLDTDQNPEFFGQGQTQDDKDGFENYAFDGGVKLGSPKQRDKELKPSDEPILNLQLEK
ncbi:unnamed protein product [Calicophoron daubneyi]|uniref:Potassium channel domain-containing protein n=1 Tax=Calicophoron daubneyi TaxID=300641 RepID=A0AAV2TLL1_CALDB